MKDYLDIDICTHLAEEITEKYNAVAPVIVQTSNFYYKTYEDFLEICKDEKNNYMYTRGSNPTTKILENKLAKLENGERCKVFSSGMGAISATLISLLKAGDHILTLNTVYGQATSFMESLKKFGITYSNIRVENLEDIKLAIKDTTKLIYMESPSSQHIELLDLEEVAKIAKEKNILTVVDNTWSTPINQKPLDYGIDIVIHSCSKYISGTSDVVAGAVVSREELIEKIFDYGHQNLGATNSPINSWLLIKSLRTLPIRMKYHNDSIIKIIDYLKNDSRIRKIFHPYVANEYQKKLAKKYLKGYGSLLSFELECEDFEKIKNFVNSLKVVRIGVSWGGYESLILPAFKGNNQESLEKRGIKKSHIRLYIGLETPETIIEDLKQALSKID